MIKDRDTPRPWVIDAKDIASPEDFQRSLFHSNQIITRFLDERTRNAVLISAPKGYGKTLLLQIKRSVMEERSGMILLPENALFDKPIGTALFTMKDSDSFLEDPQYWRSVWLIAISSMILKSQKVRIDELSSPGLRTIFANARLLSACDIFANVISLSRRDYISATEDFRSLLMPEFRALHSQIALFIDNVDEYFEHALALRESSAGSKGVNRAHWFGAQHGLAHAARELNSINNHIKICASIRQEVFQSDIKNDPLAVQLRSSAFELRYEKQDLIEIIKKNILAETQDRLVDPREQDPIKRFFGTANRQIVHQYTNEYEPIEEFFLRHTLWRPRDIAIIGQLVAEMPPARRTTLRLREEINHGANIIAETYLGECRPHVANLREEILFPLLPSNVLTRRQVETISKKYDQKINSIRGTYKFQNHVFCDLYRLGLLGYVKGGHKTRALSQHFQGIGETSLEKNNILPYAETYLVHPVLYELIQRHNNQFFSKLDSLNIVGRGRPWRQASDIGFVLMGDVESYSHIMADPDLAPSFPIWFNDIVRALARNLIDGAVVAGDGVRLIDRNWKNVVAAACELSATLRDSIYRKNIRFGGDAGVLRFPVGSTGKKGEAEGGALRTASRLEACGVGDKIVVTDRFRDFALKIDDDDHHRFLEASGDDLPRAIYDGTRFNFAKPSEDEGVYHKAFFVS